MSTEVEDCGAVDPCAAVLGADEPASLVAGAGVVGADPEVLCGAAVCPL
jgi:hypothetical protein